MADAREAVLRAIGPAIGGEPPPVWPARLAAAGHAAFEDAFRRLGGEVVDAVALAALPGRRWCVEPAAGPLPEAWGAYEQSSPWDADLGVTVCACLVAETGSVVLAGGPGRARLASLCPSAHLVLARQGDVVGTLAEAIDRLGPRNGVVVTGPSRSADIEGVLVRGVHGPGRILLVWV